MSLTVRPATQADKAAATAVLAASYAELLAPDYEPDVLAAALPKMTTAQDKLLACGTWYVVEAPDGRVVGVGGYTAERPGTGEVEPGLGHLRHFGTDPSFTGRGVGRALIEHSLSEGSAAGIDHWECYSTLTAVPFYARFGFVETERFQIAMGENVHFPSVRMVRDIRDSG